MKALALIALLLSIVFSPNLFFTMGINYHGEGGSALTKLHPITYLGLLTASVFLMLHHWPKNGHAMSRNEWALHMGGLSLVQLYVVFSGASVSIPMVTFITPLLFVPALQSLTPASALVVERVFRALVLVNSAVGIWEFAASTSLLPRIAGEVILLGDARSFALLGHPLTSSFLTGLIIIYLVNSISNKAASPSKIFETIVHLGALMCFGGRSAILATALLCGWILLASRASALRRVNLAVLLVLAIVQLAASDIGKLTLARFVWDDSANTRLAAVGILELLRPEQLLLGIHNDLKLEILAFMRTPFGIEISWIAWIVDYGIPMALVLAISVVRCAWVLTRRIQGGNLYLAYMLFITSASLSIGSKSLILFWFYTFTITFGQVLQSPAQKPAHNDWRTPRPQNLSPAP
jgi:hypothetical protein